MMEPDLAALPGASPRKQGPRRKVLVLHQHYWPEIAATAQILSDLCEDLAAAGHDVTVVCGQPSYRVVDATQRPSEEVHRGVRIVRVSSYTPERRTIPKRLLHYGSYFATSLARALREQRPDVCFVMSTPPLLLGITGTMLRALRRVPFIYSVQDLYPDIAVHVGLLREDSLITRSIEQITRICYGAASALVALSPGMAGRLAMKGIAADRIHVIPNWADTSAVVPCARDNAFARLHGFADRFVVQYSGNIGLSQGLGCVIEAADQLRDLPVQIAIVGDGNARAELEAQARARGLANVVFHPPQPREGLSNLLGSSDVGLVTMKRGVGSDLVPSKLYGIMAAARPVLAAVEPTSEIARVLREHRCGWLVEPENPAALADGIRRAFESSELERRQMGERGRQAGLDHYSRSVLTHRYETLIQQVCR